MFNKKILILNNPALLKIAKTLKINVLAKTKLIQNPITLQNNIKHKISVIASEKTQTGAIRQEKYESVDKHLEGRTAKNEKIILKIERRMESMQSQDVSCSQNVENDEASHRPSNTSKLSNYKIKKVVPVLNSINNDQPSNTNGITHRAD